jgi:hypothetical protein
MSTRTRVAAISIAAAVFTGGVLGGVGAAGEKARTKRIERTLRRATRDLGVEPKETTCPRRVRARTGTSFVCTSLLVDDQQLRFGVELTRRRDSRVVSKYEALDAVIDVAKLAEYVRTQSGNEGAAVKVACGDLRPKLVVPVDGQVPCRVESLFTGAFVDLPVTIVDLRGNATWTPYSI